MIEKKEIESLIPHSGLMCLNDKVLQWDNESLLCTSRTHLQENNPLIKSHKLSAVHAIEYCAQAMAIHGGLLARQKKVAMPSGFIAAVKNIELACEYLDDIKHDLMIFVKQLIRQNGNLIYEFRMYWINNDTKHDIATGRVTIMEMADST